MTSWKTMPQFPWDDGPERNVSFVQVKCLACGSRFGFRDDMPVPKASEFTCHHCAWKMSEIGFGRLCGKCEKPKETGKPCERCDPPLCPNCKEPSGMPEGFFCDVCESDFCAAMDDMYEEVHGG